MIYFGNTLALILGENSYMVADFVSKEILIICDLQIQIEYQYLFQGVSGFFYIPKDQKSVMWINPDSFL